MGSVCATYIDEVLHEDAARTEADSERCHFTTPEIMGKGIDV
jgi:hypothetical protein